MRKTVVSICGDPGGASALVPVLDALSSDQAIRLINYTYHQAVGVLNAHHLTHTTLVHVTFDEVLDLLKNVQPFLVLTATSHNADNFEKLFILAARQLQVNSLSILDFWSNYALRFSDASGNLRYLPDKIAVMDERAARDMVAAGIPERYILVSGQPAFDALLSCRQNFSDEKKTAIRAQYGANLADCLLVVFVSQPLRAFYGEPESDTYLGYDEHGVLQATLFALEQLCLKHKQRLVFLIRPHPREDMSAYAMYQSDCIDICVSMSGDSRELVMASDLVIGMTSVLLVEACHLDCPVLSLQLDVRASAKMDMNVFGEAILSVYAREHMMPGLSDLLYREQGQNMLKPSPQKSRHAVRTLMQYIRELESKV